MTVRTLPLLLPLLLAWPAAAQRFDALHPPNTYRNADNPHYWRNRPPHAAYWQQDVHYTLRARLDEVNDRIEGEGSLVYWNNSPDTLRHVFFHLYQNAYNAGSHADLMHNGRATRGDTADHGTTLHRLRVGAADLRTEADNTVLKAWLPEPLPPGGRVTFTLAFTTRYGMGVPRRMKLFNAWGFKHYDGVHWYPRIAVYDAHMGWDTQQHLGHELYGDFGTFDVTLDMPADMVVEATGWLQNRDEVLPRDLRERLDLKHFANKPWNEPPGVVTPYEPGRRKRWRYHAENVHDFAFTADPTYRIGEAWWNGVQCIALVQEPHASGWRNAAEYTARIIETFSRDIGPYAYPKMVVADARDGMEYPMLTLDGGRDPGYRSLLVHEVGHNWFYGMIGNNETYRALLDEGFTQFLTAWGLEHIDGDTLVEDPPQGRYLARFSRPALAREDEVYRGYMRDAVRNELPPIDTHSDGFGPVAGRGNGYGHVYSKTATMLYNLQYLLGDSVFLAAMQAYFRQWYLCHPTVTDMRESFIRASGVDLNPFFDAWLQTDKLVDYRVCGVTRRMRSEGQTIRLRRRGGIAMPIDLQVTARDGTVHDFHIPNDWYVKPTTATVLPRWTGWDGLRRTYVARVDIPTGIAAVRIDTSLRLADAYQPDNSLPRAVSISFDHHVRNPPDRRHYEAFGRPDLWWNAFDGLKVGAHLHGSYFGHAHRLWLTAWVNTGIGQALPQGRVDTRHDAFSYVLRYSTGTTRLLKGSSIRLQARHLDGLELYGGGASWTTPDERTTLRGDLRYMIRRDSSDLTYLPYPDAWTPDALSGLLDLAVDRSYDTGPLEGIAELRLRQPMVGSHDQGAHLRLTSRNTLRLGRLDLHLRALAQYGTGAEHRETALYLGGAAPEELVENKFTRSIGAVPHEWAGGHGSAPGHFHHGGGLNLRGYAGYAAPETAPDGGQVLTYRGNTGMALSAELDLDGLLRFRPKGLHRYLHLDAYLFGDLGSMGYRHYDGEGQRLVMAPLRADAGAGLALTIKRWGPLADLDPLTLRFDMPLLLSALPAGETDHFAFRWAFGIGRSF